MISAALIVAYKRPQGVERVLKKLKGSRITRIYVAIDGPKSGQSNEATIEIMEILDKYYEKSKFEIYTWARSENFGLAKSVISAIDWFFEHENAGIILEDDLEPTNAFVDFSNLMLLRYEYDNEVLLISGNQFFPELTKEDEVYFTHYPLIWGWATTAAKWRKIKTLILNRSQRPQRFVKPKVLGFWGIGNYRAHSRYVDSWAIPFAYGMVKSNFLCVLPPKNMVLNHGNDEVATHTGNSLMRQAKLLTELPANLILLENDRHNNAKNFDSYLEKSLYPIRNRNNLSLLKLFFLNISHKFYGDKTDRLIEDFKNVSSPEIE
jgi:hypothetical protein